MGRDVMESVMKTVDWAASDIHAPPATRAWADGALLWVWAGKDLRSGWQASLEASEDELEASARFATRSAAWLNDRSATWAAAPWSDTIPIAIFDDSKSQLQLVRVLAVKIQQAIDAASRKAEVLDTSPPGPPELWLSAR